MKINLEDLQNSELFVNLSNKILLNLARRMIRRHFHKGEIVFIEGDYSDEVYFVFKGELTVFKTSLDGREQVLVRLREGAVFNLIPVLLDEEPYNISSVRAAAELDLFILSGTEIRAALKNHPDLGYGLLKMFARRMKHMNSLAADLSLRSVRSRLAGFLIQQADSETTPGWLTQDEIAAQIGTVRDVVGRLLREFEALGCIQKVRHQIILLDRRVLESIAGLESIERKHIL